MKGAKQSTKILEVTLSPLIYREQNCVCICERDISYEVKSEDLSEALEYKNKLLKFVSHEFRTPLNCSIPMLEAIKDLVPTDLYTKYLSPALNSTKMLVNLVNDILDHAQI